MTLLRTSATCRVLQTTIQPWGFVLATMASASEGVL